MLKFSKKITACLAVLIIAIGLITSLSSYSALVTQAADTTDTGTDSGGVIFDAEHTSVVQCEDTRWDRTDYYDASGNLVGTALTEAGVVKSSFNGSFSTSIHTTGGVAPHSATMVECYGWGLGCTAITAVQACQ